MQRKFLISLLASCLLVGLANAQNSDNSKYLSLNIGVAGLATLDSSIIAVTNPTRCDVFLYPDPSQVPSNDPACTDTTPRELSSNDFEPEPGLTGGVALGIDRGTWRYELEYRLRRQGEDVLPLFGTASNQAVASKELEWSTVYPPIEYVSNYGAHQFFANLFYDFSSESQWTPFIGAGVGIASVEVRYSRRLLRKTLAEGYQDVEPPLTVADRPAAAAGTMSILDQNVNDTLFGVQLIAGLDYALAPSTALGFTIHWARFGDLNDNVAWSILRSHRPVRADGVTPMTGELTFSNIQYLAATLGMKHRF